MKATVDNNTSPADPKENSIKATEGKKTSVANQKQDGINANEDKNTKKSKQTIPKRKTGILLFKSMHHFLFSSQGYKRIFSMGT